MVSDLSREFPDQHALPPSYNNTPENLCTDYLKALRQHTEAVLKHKLPQSVLRTTPIEYIITVPAVWSDMAQAKTRNCAEVAGMGKRLQIISEPEAAAIYALHAMDPHSIKVGDTFVLCDAGGGTVDLISYTVSGLKPILQVEEAAMGTGRICGSTFLNRIFQKFLEDKLGLNEEWDDEVIEDAMKRFELVTKKVFRGDLNEEYIIPGLLASWTLLLNLGKANPDHSAGTGRRCRARSPPWKIPHDRRSSERNLRARRSRGHHPRQGPNCCDEQKG